MLQLLRVVQQIVHDAGFAILIDADGDARQFCLQRYNDVCLRIKEIKPALGSTLKPLPDHASSGQIRLAARDLAARLRNEISEDSGRSLLGCLLTPMFNFSGLDAPAQLR